ncbi:MAG: zinc ABC transporter substrate-binding protein [Candidatus Poribacteria bacterium]|nr:zinc ABC transporter substrate-binding protein [Candidatus Poribacteria bacterium]
MRKIISLGLLWITVLFSCTDQQRVSPPAQNLTDNLEIQGRPIRVVTTIGMIADLAKNIGGEMVEVTSLMGTGVDPHLYKASAGDVTLVSQADLILYNGLHLEAGMSGVLERLSDQKPNQVLAVTKNIDRLKLTAPPEFAGAYDPHVWFDVTLWTNVAETIRSALVKLMPSAEAHFQTRAKKYILQLEDLHIYVKEKATQIEASKRVLVTAHDAFGYFGQAYGFEVRGLQGISTATEAGTADVRNLAQFIADRKIPAIFVESSVPRQSIEAVQAAVQARKFEVQIGGELFSDAMGNPDTKEGTYIGMVQHNIDTIFDGLTGNN